MQFLATDNDILNLDQAKKEARNFILRFPTMQWNGKWRSQDLKAGLAPGIYVQPRYETVSEMFLVNLSRKSFNDFSVGESITSMGEEKLSKTLHRNTISLQAVLKRKTAVDRS